MTSQDPVPLLSVTVLNYNYGHYLPKCLDSILSQTMTDFELILINDCSTDNSLDVIQSYLEDKRVKLVNHVKNKGYVASLIEGCNLSQGKYITVISADDYALDSQAFEKACKVMEDDEEISLFYSAWNEVDDNGNVLYERRAADYDYTVDGLTQLRTQLLTSYILHSGTVIRRASYVKVGGYDSSCRYAVDNNLWLILCTVGKVSYTSKTLYAYRAHNTNLSNSKEAFWETTEEMILGIDVTLNRLSLKDLPDKAKLRRQAKQRALVAVPTHDIFARRYHRGWNGWWQSFWHYPILTLFQLRTISIVICTIVGPYNYKLIILQIRKIINKKIS